MGNPRFRSLHVFHGLKFIVFHVEDKVHAKMASKMILLKKNLANCKEEERKDTIKVGVMEGKLKYNGSVLWCISSDGGTVGAIIFIAIL